MYVSYLKGNAIRAIKKCKNLNKKSKGNTKHFCRHLWNLMGIEPTNIWYDKIYTYIML